MNTTPQTAPTKDSLKSPVASSPVTTNEHVEPMKTLKDKYKGQEMLKGRKESALADARGSLRAALEALGLAGADDRDLTEPRNTVAAAEARVKELEASVTAIEKRMREITEERRKEGVRLANEREYDVLSRLAEKGKLVDQKVAELGELMNQHVIPLMNEARLLPNTALQVPLMTASAEFKHRILAAVGTMPGCGNLAAFLLPNQWSASLPKPKAEAK